MASDGKELKPKERTSEEIFGGFQMLRSEQRHVANKLSEMEVELNEHKIVLDTLKDVDGGRKCYRMFGGVLCERTVQDVVPDLEESTGKLAAVIENLTEQLAKKGLEVNDYKEKFNIKIRGQDEQPASETVEEGKPRAGNVLVVNPI